MNIRVVAVLAIVSYSVSGWCGQWVEYRSENVVVYSDQKPQQVHALVTEFERFRAVAVNMMGVIPRHHENLQMFIFADEEEFRAIEPDRQIPGYYRDTTSGPRMALGAGANLNDLGPSLFHEYVHGLLRSKRADQMPLWYDEGWADFLGNAQLDADSLLIGGLHPVHNRELPENLMPLKTLLRPDLGETDAAYWASYTASSWLFMHYLNLGHLIGEASFFKQVEHYLALWRDGKDPVVAFEYAFGMRPEAMDRKLKAYLERQSWTPVRISTPRPEHAIEARQLSKNEVAFALGDMAYQAGQATLAREYLRQVEADKASVAQALALRAVIESGDGQLPLAQHYLKVALTKDAGDALVLGSAAHVLWNKLIALPAGDRAAALHLATKVKELAERALVSDPTDLEAMRFLWRAELRLGRLQEAVDVMLLAYRTKPTDVRLNFEIGSYFATTDEPARAEKFLRRVVQWDHLSKRRQQAHALLQSLDGRNPAIAGSGDAGDRERQAVLFPPLEFAPR